MCGCEQSFFRRGECCCFGGFRRQFFSKEEKISDLESYKKELESELKEVLKKIEELRKEG